MKIEFVKEYKSINTMPSIEFPDFVVITGVNGSGKTQLLTGISTGNIIVKEDDSLLTRNCKFVPSHSLVPMVSKKFEIIEPYKLIDNLWNNYSQLKENLEFDQHFEQVTLSVEDEENIKIISQNADKDKENLTYQDFQNFSPFTNAHIVCDDIFSHNFSNLFKTYYLMHDDNRYRRFRNHELSENISFKSNDEFENTFGEQPWILVNRILEEANLSYFVNTPSEPRDKPFSFKLINKQNKSEVAIEDLSSGEKVILTLAFSLYNFKFNIPQPKLLLLDEPDASLHPSMTRQFLKVIENVFVKERGIKVIMTTHSPTTVALCNEDSLYVMNKEEPRIIKTSRDSALKVLTTGVPSFSVNHENRRQVFVESKNDVSFFEKLYQSLSELQNSLLNPEISLTFISSGESQTNFNGIKIETCNQVINITQTLRNAGNKFIFGIIDWDSKNKSRDGIFVLGENIRYSIENYIFDPLFLAALLLREKIVNNSELNLANNETYFSLKNLDNGRLQFIVDFIIQQVANQVNPTTTDTLSVKLINGVEIVIPQWYLQRQGHTLESDIITIYPQLNDIKRNREEALKQAILTKIIIDMPELLPIEVLKLFNDIQTK